MSNIKLAKDEWGDPHYAAPAPSPLSRQTRGNFDVDAVIAMLRQGGEPAQGWPSLVEEACHVIYRNIIRRADLKAAITKALEYD